MSAFLPAPPTIVVFSLSIITFLARPSISTVTFSSLMPRSAETMVPPVRIAMSSSIALRRSPKPGALAAAQLVDHQRRERLTLYILGNDQQRLARLHHRFQQRQQLLQSGQLLFVDQDIRILHLDPHFVGIGDEVRGDVAAVELHALDHFELGLERLRLL